MSEFDDLVTGEAASPAPQPTPVAAPQVKLEPKAALTSAVREQRSGVHPAWVGVFAFTTVMFFVLWVSTWITMPTPGPRPSPVDGAYVAIFYDDKEKGQYTQEQITAIDSAAVAQFLDESVTGWHKFDVDQLKEIKNLDPIYSELAGVHRPRLPAIVGKSGRLLINEEIKDADQLIGQVKRLTK